MKPEIKVETWTPTAAKKELEEQEKRIARGEYRNRPVNDKTVRRYANDMRQGHWLVNNQGIGFDTAGNLLDGRHRLYGVSRCGVPVDLLTFRGLEPHKNGSGVIVNPQDTIDNGRVRSMGNQFAMDGVLNAQVSASAVRAIVLIASYPMVRKVGTIPGRSIYNMYKEPLERFSSMVVNKRIRSVYLAPLLMYALIKPRKAEEFFRDFTSLVGLKDGSPIIALDAYARAHSGHAGTDELKLGLCATALALFHFQNDTKVNMIRHSTIGVEWLQKECKEDVKKILNFIGEEALD